MKPVEKRKATGVLAELLANIDLNEKELLRTRKRMMIASKIADAMRNAGYSQKEFAAIMGKSETVISEWLSGDRNFTIDTLSDIEESLNISLLNTKELNVIIPNDEYVEQTSCKCIYLSGYNRYEEYTDTENYKVV